MKKIINLLVIISIFCTASVALAAGPFSDVPVNHWAYDSLKKLATDGILTGYNDDAINGGKVITRYEMAIIVGKVLEKRDIANEEQKEAIDKLSLEFAKELATLGVNVKPSDTPDASALKVKPANTIQINGYARFRWEWGSQASDHNRDFLDYYSHYPQGQTHTQVSNILFLDKQFDAKNYAHTSIGALVNNGPGETNWQLFEGYYGHREGTTEYKIGRMLASVGNGFLYQQCYSDGVGVTFGVGTDLTTRLYRIYHGGLDWSLADVTARVNKDTSVWVGHIVDDKSDESTGAYDYFMSHAKTSGIGFTYRGVPNVTLTGAYGVNSAAVAKVFNNGNSAKAGYVQARYKGANPGVLGSYGLWVGYRKADNGFDIISNMSGEVLDGNLNWIYPSQGGFANNAKGFEFGIEKTLFPNSVLQIKYAGLKALTANDAALISSGQPPLTDLDRKYLVSQLTWYY